MSGGGAPFLISSFGTRLPPHPWACRSTYSATLCCPTRAKRCSQCIVSTFRCGLLPGKVNPALVSFRPTLRFGGARGALGPTFRGRCHQGQLHGEVCHCQGETCRWRVFQRPFSISFFLARFCNSRKYDPSQLFAWKPTWCNRCQACPWGSPSGQVSVGGAVRRDCCRETFHCVGSGEQTGRDSGVGVGDRRIHYHHPLGRGSLDPALCSISNGRHFQRVLAPNAAVGGPPGRKWSAATLRLELAAAVLLAAGRCDWWATPVMPWVRQRVRPSLRLTMVSGVEPLARHTSLAIPRLGLACQGALKAAWLAAGVRDRPECRNSSPSCG
jgi:hypothetical protein